jgi:hypothetical protein
MSRFALLALLLALALAPAAAAPARAAPLLPPSGKVFAGAAMGSELSDLTRRTGRSPAVWEQFVAVGHPYQWAIDLAAGAGTRLMLAVSAAPGQDQPASTSPGQIAGGRADNWLLSLRASLAAFGKPVYLRFLAEMNNCHNGYAPIACNGRFRGRAFSAAAFIAAWRRVAVVMRGGAQAAVDAQLRRLHQPPLRGAGHELAAAQIAMVWSPMTAGSPSISSLEPGRFWPGRRWTDWSATSLYSRFPNFRDLTPFYERFAARQRLPFMFAEWAMWGNGDPGFVRELMSWTRAHRRTRMLVYNQGKRSDGPFRLVHYPAAARALRKALASSRFSVG